MRVFVFFFHLSGCRQLPSPLEASVVGVGAAAAAGRVAPGRRHREAVVRGRIEVDLHR